MSRAPRRPGAAARPLLSGALARLLMAAGAGALLLPVVAYMLVGAVPRALLLALAIYLVAIVLSAALMRRGYPHEVLGFANLATLLRLIFVSALVAPLAASGAVFSMVAVATLALLSDGVDGWLARRQGCVSEFGARFDMEVDAALGLVLALNAWSAEILGPQVLLLGLPRYLFALAAWHRPWIRRPLPERFGRKLICVLQIIALISLQLPALAGPPAAVIFGAALAALGWSFGRDLVWLWRNRS